MQITNFEFSKEFDKAIEAKVIAAQQVETERNSLERAKVQQQQQVTQAEAKAAADIAKAKGEAEATRLTAQANADAIRLRAEALAQNQRLVELEAVQRWDGKLPQYNLGGNSLPFLSLFGQAPAPAAR